MTVVEFLLISFWAIILQVVLINFTSTISIVLNLNLFLFIGLNDPRQLVVLWF